MARIECCHQLDAMDCGPASLKMIAAYYGKEYSIQTLRDYCHITRNQEDRFLIHSDEEYLVVTRIMSIFALYNVNKHSMLRQKQEKSGTGICHVMQGKESKTCPCDSQH